MKKIILGFLISLGMLVPVPAYAGHGYEDDCQGGGCGNEREESYNGAGCKYVCPSFDESPVHDAFNFSPEICMPGATCHYGDDKKERQPEQQPASQPNPACLVPFPYHCDPHPGGK